MVFLIIVIVGLLNFFYLSPPVVNWDEGTHAIWGFREWLALKDHSLAAFFQFSQNQFAYPPLGSWFIAFINFPFEFSMGLTRFVSTLGFIVGGFLLFLISRQLLQSKRVQLDASLFNFLRGQNPSIRFCRTRDATPRKFKKPVVYHSSLLNLILNTNYLILLLYLTSPAILFYSVTVFKESWGMALTILVFYLYFRAINKKTFWAYLAVGFSLMLLFFEKYNYAVLLVLTFGLEAIVELSFYCFGALEKTRPSRIKVGSYIRRQIAIFALLLISAFWWIFWPTNKLPWFLDIMRSDWNPVTVGLGSRLEYLLFYVQSIRVSYVFSDVLFLLLLIGYFMAIRDLGLKKIRVLFVFFTFNFVLGTWHSINLQDRYIYTSVPALFLLAGYELEKLYFLSLLAMTRRGFYLFIMLFVIVVVKDLFSLPSYLKSNATHMLSSPLYNESDYHDTIFNFDKNNWPREARSGSARQESPEGVIDYILDNVDINKPVEIVGYTSEISPDWIELRMALRRREISRNKSYNRYNGYNNYNKFLVTIEVKPSSRLYTYDYRRANSWQLGKIKEIERQNKDSLLKEKEFRELGMGVKIYGL